MIKSKIKSVIMQLNLIDSIPDMIWLTDAPNINRELADSIIFDFHHDIDINEKDLDNCIKDNINYINHYANFLKNTNTIQYVDPKSVIEIMKLIGSKGILNSDHGKLYIFRTKELVLSKLDWVYIINHQEFFVVKQNEKSYFDIFLKKYEEYKSLN